MANDGTEVITQKEGDRFALDHGGVAVYGNERLPALRHEIVGEVVHTTGAGHPLVHMICWDEEKPCDVAVSGRVTVVGDEEAPIPLRVRHHFENDHHQSHRIETKLAEPIHHALQMRTPLELRFCNTWHAASDYRLEINLGNNRIVSVHLTGATVATPQPCDSDDCPPPTPTPLHP